MNTASPLVISSDGPVVTLTLNRPDKRNALNTELLDAVCEAVAHADATPAQRILVLRGAGSVFCSGLDLAEANEPGQVERSADGVERALRLLANTRLITIAAVQGAAVAGGAGLMSACDFTIATREAKFGYPELRRGIVPAMIMVFLRRQLRERDVRELLLLGRLCGAERALEIGLISRVVPDVAALETEVQTIISSVLQGAPAALAETKRLLMELWPSEYEEDFRRAHAVHLAARASPEAAEGIAAFNEKRAPKWAPRP